MEPELYASGRKDLQRLDPPVRLRILQALGELVAKPTPGQVIKLKGRAGYRLRVGDWRVLFMRNDEQRVIEVDRVLPRGRAYRD